jgi:periplasmic divalent cation tolerance protein
LLDPIADAAASTTGSAGLTAGAAGVELAAMPEEILLVFTTWPEVAKAREAAQMLVHERLAACANIAPAVESIYRWEGKVETAAETLMILKTTSDRYPQLEARIKELHSYEVPEVVAIHVDRGLPAYLRWAEASCEAPA